MGVLRNLYREFSQRVNGNGRETGHQTPPHVHDNFYMKGGTHQKLTTIVSRLKVLHAIRTMWGFPESWGDPNNWLVFLRWKIPIYKWMIYHWVPPFFELETPMSFTGWWFGTFLAFSQKYWEFHLPN